jgi:hypothetical protein
VGSGEQIGRTAAILHENLHKDFWVTNMIADVGADDELGISRDKQRPILMVKGRTRQGTGRVNERFDLLVASIEAGLDGLQMKSRLGDGGAVFEIELSTLIPGSEGLATAAEEDSDEELVEDAE